jgi:pyruvate formate lyase activating enzyme
MQIGVPVIFRVPVIPTVNDAPDDIQALAAFVRRLADQRLANSHSANLADAISLELLPFHRLAETKYRSLGLGYRAGELTELSKEKLSMLVQIAQAQGVVVRCGTI